MKMSLPNLRKPKAFKSEVNKSIKIDEQLLIITLVDGKKLVVTSDSLHGIIMEGNLYKCVFCNVELSMPTSKELHKLVENHKRFLEFYPFIEELSENLVRQIDKSTCYCTICNVTTSTSSIMRHIKSEAHLCELNRAVLRANYYKPTDNNNNNNNK